MTRRRQLRNEMDRAFNQAYPDGTNPAQACASFVCRTVMWFVVAFLIIAVLYLIFG